MFAIGLCLLVLFLLLALSRPLIIRSRFGGWLLGVAIALMVCSLVVLAWRWLP